MLALIEYYITDISYIKFIILNISFPKTCKWSLVFFQTWRKISSSSSWPSRCLCFSSLLLLLGTYFAGAFAQIFVSCLLSNTSENLCARKIRIQRVSIANFYRLCEYVKSLYILIIFCTVNEQVHHSVTLIEFQDSIWS